MADKARTLTSQSVSLGVGGGVTPIPVQAASHQALISALNAFVDREQDNLDRSTVIRAREAGKRAGQSGDIQQMTNSTIYGRNYNVAAADTYVNRTLVETSDQLEKTYQMYKNDPEAFEEAASSLKNKIMQNMPEFVQPDFDLNFGKNVMAYKRQTIGNHEKNIVDQSKSAFDDAEFILLNRITNLAESGDMDAANNNFSLYLDQLDRNGPVGGVDRTMPDGTMQHIETTGALSHEEVATKRRVAMQRFERAAITGEFRRSKDKVGYIRGLQNNKRFNEMYSMEEQTSVVNGLYSELYQQLALENFMDARVRRERKDTMGRIISRYALNPSDSDLYKLGTEYAARYGMDEDVLRMQKIHNGEEGSEDISLVRDLKDAVLRGGYTKSGVQISEMDISGYIGRGLKAGTASSLINDLQNVRDGGNDYFTSWEDYKQSLKRFEAAFPVRVDATGRALEADIDNDNAQRTLKDALFDRMISSYSEWRKNGSKPVDRPDPRQIANLMITNERKDRDAKKTDAELLQIPAKYRNDPKKIAEDRRNKTLPSSLATKYYQILEKHGKLEGINVQK